jgi:hypothetical protein
MSPPWPCRADGGAGVKHGFAPVGQRLDINQEPEDFVQHFVYVIQLFP